MRTRVSSQEETLVLSSLRTGVLKEWMIQPDYSPRRWDFNFTLGYVINGEVDSGPLCSLTDGGGKGRLLSVFTGENKTKQRTGMHYIGDDRLWISVFHLRLPSSFRHPPYTKLSRSGGRSENAHRSHFGRHWQATQFVFLGLRTCWYFIFELEHTVSGHSVQKTGVHPKVSM